jgi:hypothetical protein
MSMNYNVDKYTILELLTILEINVNDLTEQLVFDTTNKYISRFKEEGNSNLVRFFQDMQTKLLQYIDSQKKDTENDEYDEDEYDDKYIPNDNTPDLWMKYQALPQNNNPVQKNKNTDRINKVSVYDNQHLPMNREQLGVANNFQVPVAQDTLNPNLENITSRFINLDSQFRQATGGSNALSTDYTLDLSDPLTNVLNMRLYSIQIPFSWYVIDYQYGNTCFWVTNKGRDYKIQVDPGNYASETMVVELNRQFQNAGFSGPFSSSSPVSFNITNGKITINLSGYTDPDGNIIIGVVEGTIFDENKDAYFTFFDFSGKLNCLGGGNGCSAQNITFNSTLGWILGYRFPIVPVYSELGNKADSVLDLNGPKYFILIIDDYNQNHINNGLVSITELSNKLALPNYYDYSQPKICVQNASEGLSVNTLASLANLSQQDANALGINSQNVSNALQDKIDIGYGKRPVVLPTAPRTLTNAQIYTINEIIKNRERNTTYRGRAPTNSDTFALIPIKRNGLRTGDMYVEFGGSMQDNKRIYFGPVNIERMRIKLVDDKGYLVDLHGCDWCVTLISENLYQY